VEFDKVRFLNERSRYTLGDNKRGAKGSLTWKGTLAVAGYWGCRSECKAGMSTDCIEIVATLTFASVPRSAARELQLGRVADGRQMTEEVSAGNSALAAKRRIT